MPPASSNASESARSTPVRQQESLRASSAHNDPQPAIPRAARRVGMDHYGVGMECRIDEALVHYVEHGGGVPLVALHGAGVDHREIEGAVEAVVPGTGYRRIYPGLPGKGLSTTDGLTCNDDVVTLVGDFIGPLGLGPVMPLRHSSRAPLARG